MVALGRQTLTYLSIIVIAYSAAKRPLQTMPHLRQACLAHHLVTLANAVSELKSTNSKNSTPAYGSTGPTNTDISLHHSDSLQCRQTSSANHAPFEAGLSSPSLNDTSLREMLCSSTPIHDDRMGQAQFLFQSNPIDGHNHQINREQYDHLDKEIALISRYMFNQRFPKRTTRACHEIGRILC